MSQCSRLGDAAVTFPWKHQRVCDNLKVILRVQTLLSFLPPSTSVTSVSIRVCVCVQHWCDCESLFYGSVKAPDILQLCSGQWLSRGSSWMWWICLWGKLSVSNTSRTQQQGRQLWKPLGCLESTQAWWWGWLLISRERRTVRGRSQMLGGQGQDESTSGRCSGQQHLKGHQQYRKVEHDKMQS